MEEYLCYKDLFILLPKEQDREISEISICFDFDDVQAHLASDEAMALASVFEIPCLYNGLLIPAKYIPSELEKIKDSTYTCLLELRETDLEKQQEQPFYNIDGFKHEIIDIIPKTDCWGAQNITKMSEFILNKISKNKNIDDFYIFIGYALKLYLQVDDDSVKDELIDNLKPIGKSCKNILK